ARARRRPRPRRPAGGGRRPVRRDRGQRRRREGRLTDASGPARELERRPRRVDGRPDRRAALVLARQQGREDAGRAARHHERDPPLMEIRPVAAPQPQPADPKLTDAALGFEQLLVQQLAESLVASTEADESAGAGTSLYRDM